MPSVWCDCGALLLDDVSDTGVTPVGADEEVPFRRATDHVICSGCMRMWEVEEISARAGRPSPALDEDEDEDPIARLERLAEERRPPPGPA